MKLRSVEATQQFRELKILITLLALLACAPLGARAAQDPSLPSSSKKTVIYKTSHAQEQSVEVHFHSGHHPGSKKVPGVLLFHGGGWLGGDLGQFSSACEYFARRGLVAASANYYMHPKAELKNLGPGGKHKRVCVTDAVSAIRWFKQHANELGVDPERVVVGGGSAGGHLSMLATLNRRLDEPSDPKGFNTSVLGYLLFNPAFTTKGRDRDDDVDVFAHLKSGIAPSLFLFSEKDAWKAASDELVASLRKSGAEASMLVADNEDHSFWRKSGWLDLCLIECDRFLVSLAVLSGDPLLRKPSGIDFNPAKATP